MKRLKKKRGITLIALIITIIVMLILAGITVNLALNENNSIFDIAQNAEEENTKKTAEEKISLKITNSQMNSWAESQRMPTLQELADDFCEDDEIQYVALASKKTASLEKIQVGDNTSIFTKLKGYPYEFEINSSLQLASIDGVKVSVENKEDSWSNKNTWEKLFDVGFTLDEIVNNAVVFNKTLVKQEDISYMLNSTTEIMPAVVNSKVAMTEIGNDKQVYKYIFGDTQENIEVNSTWVSAILNSTNAITALDSTNPITVPNMTAYTSPSGEVKESSYLNNLYGWYAFNDTSTMYYSAWASGSFDRKCCTSLDSI